MDAEAAQKWMNLNSVALCFQAFIEGPNGVMEAITERVYSNSINNLSEFRKKKKKSNVHAPHITRKTADEKILTSTQVTFADTHF